MIVNRENKSEERKNYEDHEIKKFEKIVKEGEQPITKAFARQTLIEHLPSCVCTRVVT